VRIFGIDVAHEPRRRRRGWRGIELRILRLELERLELRCRDGFELRRRDSFELRLFWRIGVG